MLPGRWLERRQIYVIAPAVSEIISVAVEIIVVGGVDHGSASDIGRLPSTLIREDVIDGVYAGAAPSHIEGARCGVGIDDIDVIVVHIHVDARVERDPVAGARPADGNEIIRNEAVSSGYCLTAVQINAIVGGDQ